MTHVNLLLSYDMELFGHPCLPFIHLGLSKREGRKEGRRQAWKDTRKAKTNKRSKKLKCRVTL